VDETSAKLPLLRSPCLVQQDIQLSRESCDGVTRVVARVECARRGCTMEVEQCAGCSHFVRIETHEAGYLLLCRIGEEGEQKNETEPEESDP
jgi:hypothetical protein